MAEKSRAVLDSPEREGGDTVIRVNAFARSEKKEGESFLGILQMRSGSDKEGVKLSAFFPHIIVHKKSLKQDFFIINFVPINLGICCVPLYSMAL